MGARMMPRDLPTAALVAHNYREHSPEGIADLAALLIADGCIKNPCEACESVSDVATRTVIGWVTITGHGRIMAAERAYSLTGDPRWLTVPCRVLDTLPGSSDALVSAMASNLSARPSTAAEDAAGFGELVAAGMTVEEIAARVGRRPGFVRDRVDLLQLDPAIRPMLAAMGFSWARPLYGLPGETQAALVRVLESEGLNRSQWVALVDKYRAERAKTDAEQASMFGGDWGLSTETFDAALGRYVAEVTADRDPVADAAAIPVEMPAVWGYAEIAIALAVQRRTVNQWAARHLLPAPDMTVHGLPTWLAPTIIAWAESTGRKGAAA